MAACSMLQDSVAKNVASLGVWLHCMGKRDPQRLMTSSMTSPVAELRARALDRDIQGLTRC